MHTITATVCTELFFCMFVLPSVALRKAETTAAGQGYMCIYMDTVQLPFICLVQTKQCNYMVIMFAVDILIQR